MSLMSTTRYYENGPAQDVLRIVQASLPEPRRGEVRVRLVLSPIHNHDLITVAGGYGKSPTLPAAAGSEALGIVDAIGAGVTSLKNGDRVIAAGISGAWADYYLASAERLVRVPDALPDELAAQIAGMPFDALLAFNTIGPKMGDWLLVNAANGSVGKAILQIARSRGVHVAGLVHRDKAKAELEKEGFDHIFSTAQPSWTRDVGSTIGKARVAGGLDMVGGAIVADMLKLMSDDATLLVLGAMSNEPPRIDPAALIFKEINVQGFWASRAASRLSPAEIRSHVEDVVGLALDGEFKLPVAEVFPLSRVKEAAVASGKERDGKIMLRRD